jgi:dTMP kinase
VAARSRTEPQTQSQALAVAGAAGWLVTLEGIDGSGKSSLARALHADLRARGIDAVLTREPTGTWLGEAVKRSLREDGDALAEAFLFLADHAAHAAQVRDWLAQGQVVVSDRWGESCLAYQAASLEPVLRPLGLDPLPWLEAAQAPVQLTPACCLLLDVVPERALARIEGREDRVKFEQPGFLERVRAHYLALAKRHAWIQVLDAEFPPDALLARAVAALRERKLLP